MKRKVIFIAILLTLLLSISAASASEDLGSDIVSNDGNDEIILEESINKDTTNEELILEKSNEETLDDKNDKSKLSDGATLTFTDLNNAINGNTDSVINLNNNYTYTDADSEYKLGIQIGRSLTINGNGITIDGSKQARMFHINSGNVIFENINFINGYADGKGVEADGGAIFSQYKNSGTAKNCNFTGNHASGDGGALRFVDAENCNFIENSANKDGGAIQNAEAINCNFTRNSATWGGAGYDLFATNCNFYHNTAGDVGGAILYGKVINCTFIRNHANNYGGGLDDGTAINCIFIQNSAGQGGGAIDESKANNCTFILNTAPEDEDAVDSDCDSDCTFISNASISASDYTSRINSGEKLLFYITDENGNILDNINTTIKISKDGEDISTVYALSNDGWKVDLEPGIYDATLSIDNKSEITPASIKLKILEIPLSFTALNQLINGNEDSEINLSHDYEYDPELDLALVEGIVINRTLTINGNGHILNGSDLARVFFIDADNVVLKDINFYNAYSDRNGGAISVSDLKKNYDVMNCNFTNNKAKNGGGAMYGGTATDSTFTQNNAYYGGAIYRGTADKSKFTKNNATNGGAIYETNATNCSFENNEAEFGGAMEYGNATDSNFTNNKVTKYGGASYGSNAVNCLFTGNMAEMEGGAMYQGTAKDSSFSKNEAYQGGATCSAKVTNCTFTENKATYGGAMLLGEAKDSNFTKNTAKYGGATYNVNADNSNFAQNDASNGGAMFQGSAKYCNFTENTAQLGGAIYLGEARDSMFSKNIATDGGAAYNSIITDSEFLYNSAYIGGATYGGIVRNSNFTENTADVFGGAVSEGEVINCIFTKNSAQVGGAVQYANVTDSNFTENTANIGGAVNEGNVSNSVFLKNKADIGGAVSNTNVNNSKFIANEAKIGGAIVLNASEKYVTNSLFINNTAEESNGVAIYDDYQTATTNNKINDNIFLNHEGNEIYIANPETANTDRNWFGQNATNYEEEPSSPRETRDTWLFLNATVPESITIIETADLTFNLYVYNETSGEISLYDGDIQDEVELALSSNGNLDKETVKLGETVTYTPNIAGVGTVTGKIEDAEYTASFDVNKLDPNLSIETPDITYGENETISVSVEGTGTLTIEFEGTNYTVELEEGKGNLTIPNLPGGKKTATVYYTGDDIYYEVEKTANFTVNKQATNLTTAAVTTTYNVAKNLVISLKDANGNPLSGFKISVTIDSAKTYTTDSNGQVKINVGNLVPKTYTAKISYAGNENYSASSANAKVVVKKATPKMALKNKTYKFELKTKQFAVILKNNKNQVMKNTKLTLKVGGQTYTAKTNSQGKAIFKITKLNKKGQYTAAITYAGDKYYNKLVKKAKITVKAPAWQTIAYGSKKHATVKKIQRALKDNGFYLSFKGRYLKIDGLYHKYTRMAVKEFQAANNLKVTGKVDYATAQKLKLVA